jgi:hypothetical protein
MLDLARRERTRANEVPRASQLVLGRREPRFRAGQERALARSLATRALAAPMRASSSVRVRASKSGDAAGRSTASTSPSATVSPTSSVERSSEPATGVEIT